MYKAAQIDGRERHGMGCDWLLNNINSCARDIADLEYLYCRKWIEILWRRTIHQKSNIYNAAAKQQTPNALLKTLGKNRCR